MILILRKSTSVPGYIGKGKEEKTYKQWKIQRPTLKKYTINNLLAVISVFCSNLGIGMNLSASYIADFFNANNAIVEIQLLREKII